MKLRIVKHVCADGVERGILEYRNHWWEKWKPLHQEGKLAYVSYMGTKPYMKHKPACLPDASWLMFHIWERNHI